MTSERKTIDMTALFRPTFESAIYFAIEKFDQKMKAYPAGDALDYLNNKPTWVGYFPEEVGYTYQSLCSYIDKNMHNCVGGFKIGIDGKITTYTLEQLIKDYDPSEEK